MKLTKGIISRDEAVKLSPQYVSWIETHAFDALDLDAFYALKKGQKCLSCVDGQWVICKVTSVTQDWRNEDGPIIRIGNGEYTWRCNGDGYAVAI